MLPEVRGVPLTPAVEELLWERKGVSFMAPHVCGTQFVTNMK